MTAQACADLVARGDADRWRTVMAAPPDRRAGLLALYAFNLEIARAPYVASESMLAEIRLRWWTDAVAEIFAGAPPRRHEVVAPLAEAVAGGELPQDLFDGMIAGGEAPMAVALIRKYLAKLREHTQKRWRNAWRKWPPTWVAR